MARPKPGDPVRLAFRPPFGDYEKADAEIEQVITEEDEDGLYDPFIRYKLKDMPYTFAQSDTLRDRFDRLPIELGGWYFTRK